MVLGVEQRRGALLHERLRVLELIGKLEVRLGIVEDVPDDARHVVDGRGAQVLLSLDVGEVEQALRHGLVDEPVLHHLLHALVARRRRAGRDRPGTSA